MGGSGYYPGKPMFGGLAQGFEGAERSERGTEQADAAYLAAQQQYAAGQQQQYLERLKVALPLLRAGAAGNIPNTLLGQGAVPGTGSGAGGPAPGGGTYESAIGGIEGSGKNPRSSASGAGQFLDSTWQDFAAANPDLFKGMSPAQVMAAKSDPGLGAKAITWLAQRNAPLLVSAGAPATGQSLGLAHYIGPGPAASVMAAPDNTPVRGFVSPEAVKANPELATMTAGQLKQRYAGVPNPGFLTPPSVQVAGPGAPTGGPAAAPAPIAPAPGQTPPAASTATPAPAPGGMTFEQFQAAHPVPIAAPDLAAIQAAQTEAARQLSLSRQGLSGDPNKSLSDYNTAAAKVADLQQAAQKNAVDTQRQLYDTEQQRLLDAQHNAATLAQQAQLKQQELAQQADEADKQRAAAMQLEQVKAGQTFHQKLQEQSAEYAQANVIKPMTEQALKAHQMNLSLAQLQPLLASLPKSGGSLGAVLTANPDLGWLANAAGITDPSQTDAARLVNGLVANISTQMKPQGLGALREYEWNAFKAQLPSMLSTPDGQQKAVAVLMNMNNRIGDEASWMNNYFNRKVPDELAAKPGVTRPAHDLDVPEGSKYLSAQQMMDAQLGPVVPSYTPPNGTPPTGAGQAQWEQTLPPGKPFYRTQAVRDPKSPNQALRDNAGNVVTTKSLQVRPWQ